VLEGVDLGAQRGASRARAGQARRPRSSGCARSSQTSASSPTAPAEVGRGRARESSPRSRRSSRRCERGGAPRGLERAGRRAPPCSGSERLRHALRPRPACHLPAQRARSAPCELPHDPRRRHQRQVLDDADDRRAASGARGCAPAASPHRTCSATASGSRSAAARSSPSASPPPSRGASTRPSWWIAQPRRRATPSTQFELLTATALLEFEQAESTSAVLEAGLGGRYGRHQRRRLRRRRADQRRARAHALTSGRRSSTSRARSSTSCATARRWSWGRGSTPTRSSWLARRGGARRAAGCGAGQRGRGAGAGGGYQRRNFAAGCAAASTFLDRELDPGKVAEVASSLVRSPGASRSSTEPR